MAAADDFLRLRLDFVVTLDNITMLNIGVLNRRIFPMDHLATVHFSSLPNPVTCNYRRKFVMVSSAPVRFLLRSKWPDQTTDNFSVTTNASDSASRGFSDCCGVFVQSEPSEILAAAAIQNEPANQNAGLYDPVASATKPEKKKQKKKKRQRRQSDQFNHNSLHA